MNERIKELATQAGWMMDDEVEGFNTRLERFARLIVQECSNVLYDNELWSRDVSHVLNEHFGDES